MTTRRVKWTYPADKVNEPVVYQVIHNFQVVASIRRADVGAHGGWLVLELRGEEPEVEKALNWVRGQGIKVEDVTE